ncbi:apolipoprotein N-acyltransferase [Amycolatopsis sp. CA-230715]|uniref:apolipoprotein N-acyltransferase n=1 Tax=Amycolatopsis sp. CA-230715 TaxID=2745196 RepID=UPI001C016EA4|nr:nitrilase-related carbon-nitrogen hydrolase [Amycolatopsis sp. CA-230715]
MNKTRALWWLAAALVVLAQHTDWSVPLAAWVFPIPLLAYARRVPTRRAAVFGWLAILIGTVYWLAVTSLLFVPVAAGLFLALTVLLTLPYLADRAFASRFGPLLGSLVFPVTLVTAEYAFSFFDFGDYGTLASTQSGTLPLVQVASVTGVYGISFALAWFASVVNTVWARGFRPARRAVVVHVCVLAAVFAGGTLRLVLADTGDRTVRVAGVSAARHAQDASEKALKGLGIEYWRPEQVAHSPGAGAAFAPITEDLLASTEAQLGAGAKLVVWPETDAKVLQRDEANLLQRVAALTTAKQAYVQIGLAWYTDTAPFVRNVAILVGPSGEAIWTYDKTHPTPMEPMAPGTGAVPATGSPFGKLSTVICYDADYRGLMRRDADLMLVPANDWPGFGGLHAENAVFRAVENGYTVFRQSVNGLATAIDAQGRILGKADFYRADQQTLVADLPLVPQAWTLYRAVGDVFAWCCAAAALLLAAAALRRRTAPATGPDRILNRTAGEG